MGRRKTIAFDVTLKEYLKEIDELPLLTWEQEKELATRIIENNDPKARDILVRSNLRLVVNIAKRFSGKGMTPGDLIEEGNLGLLRAVDLFDPDHGVRFSTYAAWWIKQGIKRALLMNAQPIHIPTYMVELINHWRYTFSEQETALGRAPETEEMAQAMKLPLRKAKAIQQIVEVVNAGFQGDCEKYNAAAMLGWRVFRYTRLDIDRRPVQMIEEVIMALDLTPTGYRRRKHG